MSILIRGMEMPGETGRVFTITPDGKCYENVWDASLGVRQIGKAVPVPPHGRLIDADALLDEGADLCLCEYDSENTWGFSYDMINAAPTIIPADRKDGAE